MRPAAVTAMWQTERLRAHDAGGFTLIELLISMAVLIILAAFAYPSMHRFILHNRAVALANSLQADLQFARGQAAATRSYVSLCPVATAGTQTCASGSTSYDNGWLVYTASTPNTAYNGTASNLQRVEQAAANASVRSSFSTILTYNARGLLLTANDAGPSADVLFTVCSKTSAADVNGTSAAGYPGVVLHVGGSGRIATSALDVGASCD